VNGLLKMDISGRPFNRGNNTTTPNKTLDDETKKFIISLFNELNEASPVLVKNIEIKLSILENEVTYFNQEGKIMQSVYANNLYNRPHGSCLSIQLIEYNDNDVWKTNYTFQKWMLSRITVENGHLKFNFKQDELVKIVQDSSATIRIAVLLSLINQQSEPPELQKPKKEKEKPSKGFWENLFDTINQNMRDNMNGPNYKKAIQ
jgi:hypothetical protein